MNFRMEGSGANDCRDRAGWLDGWMKLLPGTAAVWTERDSRRCRFLAELFEASDERKGRVRQNDVLAQVHL